jgi:hypothetical protein
VKSLASLFESGASRILSQSSNCGRNAPAQVQPGRRVGVGTQRHAGQRPVARRAVAQQEDAVHGGSPSVLVGCCQPEWSISLDYALCTPSRGFTQARRSTVGPGPLHGGRANKHDRAGAGGLRRRNAPKPRAWAWTACTWFGKTETFSTFGTQLRGQSISAYVCTLSPNASNNRCVGTLRLSVGNSK